MGSARVGQIDVVVAGMIPVANVEAKVRHTAVVFVAPQKFNPGYRRFVRLVARTGTWCAKNLETFLCRKDGTPIGTDREKRNFLRREAALRAMPQAILLAVNIGLPRFNFTSLKAGLDMRDLGPVLDHNGAPAPSATKRTTVAGSSAQRPHASAR